MTENDTVLSKDDIIDRIHECLKDMSQNRLLFLLDQLKDKPSQWKRKHTRKSCYISVDYDTMDYSGKKHINNLSESGAYIEAGESFSADQELVLWLTIPQTEKPFIKIPAKVVRRDEKGIGVEFVNLTDFNRGMIKIIKKVEGY